MGCIAKHLQLYQIGLGDSVSVLANGSGRACVMFTMSTTVYVDVVLLNL